MSKTLRSPKDRSTGSFWRSHRVSILVLAALAVIFLLAALWAAPEKEIMPQSDSYAEYETARVTQVLADDTWSDPDADGAFRGEQLLLVEVKSGQYRGQTLQVDNFSGPLYGIPVREGDRVVVLISTEPDGSYRGSIYEVDRTLPLAVIVAVFLLIAVAVGGRTGAKSLAGLLITLACLFWFLIPALMKGAPTLLTVFLTCAFIAVVSLTILGGIQRKTVCAMLGSVAGVGTALLFGLAAQALCHVNGLRTADVEPLLQLRQTGVPIGLSGLLVAGIVISTLGAVMDVTMGITSALTEVHAADPKMDGRALFRSGMNIGRDMVGTMTNTLILAFLGSSLVLILYLYTMGLAPRQLLSSAFLSVEVISSASSTVGVMLTIPITALITACALAGKPHN